MKSKVRRPRTALLTGATGLVGRTLLPMLLAATQYRGVHIMVRRAVPDIKANSKLKIRDPQRLARFRTRDAARTARTQASRSDTNA